MLSSACESPAASGTFEEVCKSGIQQSAMSAEQQFLQGGRSLKSMGSCNVVRGGGDVFEDANSVLEQSSLDGEGPDDSTDNYKCAIDDWVMINSGTRIKKQFVKTKMCPYYIKGYCLNGKACSYAHDRGELRPLPDLRKTKLCGFAKRHTQCPSPSCSYAHTVHELKPSTDLVTFKTSLCFFWKKGKCFNGEKCRFAHGPSELRSKHAASGSTSSFDSNAINAPEFFPASYYNSPDALDTDCASYPSTGFLPFGSSDMARMTRNQTGPLDPNTTNEQSAQDIDTISSILDMLIQKSSTPLSRTLGSDNHDFTGLGTSLNAFLETPRQDGLGSLLSLSGRQRSQGLSEIPSCLTDSTSPTTPSLGLLSNMLDSQGDASSRVDSSSFESLHHLFGLSDHASIWGSESSFRPRNGTSDALKSHGTATLGPDPAYQALSPAGPAVAAEADRDAKPEEGAVEVAGAKTGDKQRACLLSENLPVCIQCDTRRVNVACFPCGHAKCCLQCSASLDVCPVCQDRITFKVPFESVSSVA